MPNAAGTFINSLQRVPKAPLPSGLNRAVVGLAFNGAGDLFVAESGFGQVIKFASGGGESIFVSGLNQPLGLAFDSGDNLFVADGGSGNIYKFTSTVAQSTFASGLQTPFGLAFDSAGNLYVANYGNGNITEITPGGVQSTFASGLNLPAGLAFNSAGDLFEADFGSGNIYEFTQAGAKSSFASGLSQPAFLAFQPETLVTNFNCPDDIITNNAPGQCSATVAFADDVTGSVVYTLGGSVIRSPFPFPVGTNVVTCIASNLDGSTSCSFIVLVRDVVPPMIDCPANIHEGHSVVHRSGGNIHRQCQRTVRPVATGDQCAAFGFALPDRADHRDEYGCGFVEQQQPMQLPGHCPGYFKSPGVARQLDQLFKPAAHPARRAECAIEQAE